MRNILDGVFDGVEQLTFAVCPRYQLEDIERVLLAPAEQRMTLA